MVKGLLVTYFFPPKNSIASLRTYALARYLKEYGFSMEVICPEWNGTLDLPLDVPLHHTHHIEDNINYGFYESKLRQFLVKDVLYKIFRYNFFRDVRKGSFYNHAEKLLAKLDLTQYQFVITSFNPPDVIHIGARIKEMNPSIKWIIDYRDYFSLDEYKDLGVFRSFYKAIEKKMTENCDAFSTVSQVLCANQQKLIEKPGFVCYNGFDDYELKKDDVFQNELKQFSLPVISYAGSLYNGERDLEPFFRFYSLENLDKRFTLVFAVWDELDEDYVRKTADKYSVKNLVIYRKLNYDKSILLQESSRYLLLLANTERKGNGYLTGKFFEYIKSGKPIIYSGCTDNYELYDMLIKYRLGEHFSKFDFNTIERDTRGGVDIFHRKEQVFRLGGFIDNILSGPNK